MSEAKKYLCRLEIQNIRESDSRMLEGSSEAKAALYDDQSHVIGSKLGLRILVDIGKEELDLVCGERCLQAVEDSKIIDNRSKLLREGKEIKMGISEILDSSDEDIKRRYS